MNTQTHAHTHKHTHTYTHTHTHTLTKIHAHTNSLEAGHIGKDARRQRRNVLAAEVQFTRSSRTGSRRGQLQSVVERKGAPAKRRFLAVVYVTCFQTQIL